MKTKISPLRRRGLAGAMIFAFALHGLANPAGMTVVSGSASSQTSGSQFNINTSQNAFLNWQSFNIAAGERTVFNQPNAHSVVVNQINGQSASQIYGSLQANGIVVLMNSSGFYFGPNSFVSAAGLVVSTANCTPPQNFGGTWEFNGPPPLASIVNYGSIKVGHGGSAFLIADKIENHGTIEAPGGAIGFAAGQTVTLSERPDGRGMSMQVTLPQGSVDNYGNVIADGGTIALNAKVVNQNGLIQANSVQNQNGVITLVASDALNLGAGSKIFARGDASIGGSAGGRITLKSDNTFSDLAGGEISVAGGVNGGNGGIIEVSAPNIQSLNSAMDAGAHAGFSGGEFLLDPVNIILGNSGNGVPDTSGTVVYSSGGTLSINVSTAFLNKNFSQILLQASGNITVNQFTTWDLSASTGVNHGQLTLEAGGNIIFKNYAKITDGHNWSVSLMAGYDFVNGVVAAGGGSIYLNGVDGSTTGNGQIQTAAGNLSLLAGQDIQIGSGFARTTAGGNVLAQALAGNIETGTYAHGYRFLQSYSSTPASYYQIDPSYGTGGISTEAGGNVTIVAGGNVNSFLPSGNSGSSIGGDAGSGAFGTQAGNVTVVAGGDVTGHYVVANGGGKIFAGAKMDASGNPLDASGNLIDLTAANAPYALAAGSGGSAGTSDTKLALSLVAGGWTVNAAQDINLQEVRNPNGVFNNYTAHNLPKSYHYFDYAAGAYVNLSAGNSVTLGDSSSNLPRANADGVDVPFIYAPILNIIAGVGGVNLTGDTDPYNKLILFPSAQGSLTVVTTEGGPLNSSLPSNADGSPSIFQLIVSDSEKKQFSDGNADIFGLNDHASTPVHLNHSTPVTLNISGDMNGVLLGAPEAAQINVVGDMNNSRFQGMNLQNSDVTSINVGQVAKNNMETSGLLNPATDAGLHVGGNINNRSDFTTVTVSTDPVLAYLNQAYPPLTLAANLAGRMFYNSTTRQLTIQGAVTQDVIDLLQSLPIRVYENGQPVYNSDGSPKTATVSVLDPATIASLKAEYALLGPISTTRDSGYLIGGGGTFQINARKIDLGTTLGIQSLGVSYDTISVQDAGGNTHTTYPLAPYFTKGANIVVNALDNLEMFSTVICSLNGGSVSIAAGGAVNAGSSYFTVSSSVARGIFSTSGGDISVIAGDNVNVNGSRIAAYDGGNVTVESLFGNVDAGVGASRPVALQGYYVDPVTRQLYQTSPQIPFSGILAMTFPPRDSVRYPAPTAVLGNILVEAPNGNINANLSGILQIALNHVTYSSALVTVLAGYELRDGAGNPVSAGNMSGATAVHVSDGRDINAQSSGIIASNAKLEASGSIYGLIFARNNIDIVAQQNVNVTALGAGTVSVGAGGTVSGTIIGAGGVTASGSSVDASLISANVSGSTSGQSGLGTGGAANATANAASASDDSSKVVKKSEDPGESEVTKKNTKSIALAKKMSRVTVLLPSKN